MANTSEIKNSSGFEKFLFAFTRMFALVGSIVAILGVLLLAVSLLGSDDDSFVSLSEIKQSQQAESGDVAPPEVEVKLPENIEKIFSEENKEVLRGWLQGLEKDEQKDFIENLSLIIDEAEKMELNAFDVINDYKELKLEKLEKSEFEKYEAEARRGVTIAAIFVLIMFIALMSLILVMLAVERNTRKTCDS
ncbi:MAG: hypothetical protein R6V56_01025 [Lentisphaeria bacterium]